MPADAVYLWLLTRVLFVAHAATGATRIRHSLRPLSVEGGLFPTTRASRASRTRTRVFLRCHAPPPGLAFAEPDDRLLRDIQYAPASRLKHKRLWNTGSPRRCRRRQVRC